MNHRSMKRKRTDPQHSPSPSTGDRLEEVQRDSSSPLDNLYFYLYAKRWDEAIEVCRRFPETLQSSREPSPLALACRFGASPHCISVLARSRPELVRRSTGARGTPLHEAIACETTEFETIQLLIEIDESIESNEVNKRATLTQDLDGQTPLHLLTKRRIPSHVMDEDRQAFFLNVLEILVQSCPEAVVIPDLGEYEETPIVCALKANVFANVSTAREEVATRIEQIIYDMVVIMLEYCPQAASRVFSGYRGRYTALHSAVFHGRSADTIELLLSTEASNPSEVKPCLLGNSQGELPLHFSTMRGERPRTIALLANGAPPAVVKRDASGLTPMHWTWIRYVSNIMALNGEIGDATFDLNRGAITHHSRYSAFTSLEQNDFEADLTLIRRMDPPVDFLRMRHIPEEVLHCAEVGECIQTTLHILHSIREKTKVTNERNRWTRRDIVAGLFWTKVVSLFEAARKATATLPQEESFLVHTAFASDCGLPSVSHIIAGLLPEEMTLVDSYGRLPIHYASLRKWHSWDWPRDDGSPESQASRLLKGESLRLLQTALQITPKQYFRVHDMNKSLPLHYAIETFVKACVRSNIKSPSAILLLVEMLSTLEELVSLFPESLGIRDSATMVVPFLQAAAVASEVEASEHNWDEAQLSITYHLLRLNPNILQDLKRKA